MSENKSLSKINGAGKSADSGQTALANTTQAQTIEPTEKINDTTPATTWQQYSTWGLVVIGWIVSVLVARSVLRKNARNTWIGEIKKMISTLEDSTVKFWMETNTPNEAIDLVKFGRDIKDITTLATEIRKYGGCKYNSEVFMNLRRAITSDTSANGQIIRNLPYSDFRIQTIIMECAKLKDLYIRK